MNFLLMIDLLGSWGQLPLPFWLAALLLLVGMSIVEQVSGYSRHEVVGLKLRLLPSGQVSVEEYGQTLSTLGHGPICTGELPIRSPSGRATWERTRIVPMCDDLGAITRFFKVADEMTSRPRESTDYSAV